MNLRDLSRKQKLIAIVLAAALLSGTLGFAAGHFWMQQRYPMLKQSAFANLNHTYKEIMEDYLNGAEAEALIHGAAEGMTASLKDPYSVYYTKEQGQTYMERYGDHFVGIGVELRMENGRFVISSAIKGAPAEEVGLMPDDVITALDGQALVGKTMSDLISMTRGEEGTQVTLTIVRDSLKEPFDVTITRAPVPVTTVEYRMLEAGIGLVTITRFAESTAAEFDQAAAELTGRGMKALLLDLRHNPGGLLSPAIEIASRIVPKGETVLQVVYKDERRQVTHRSKQKQPWKIPVAVLMNESSASSAEVLAAALKSKAAAEIIGVKSFGKGIVQTFRQFKDQSVLKLTEAQWRTPDGDWIQESGVEPTIEVAMPDYAFLPALPLDISLSVGKFGQEVKTAELMLQLLGYEVGEPEGIYDARTARAVSQFQRDEQLADDGILGGRSAYRLTQRYRQKIEEEDPQRIRGLEVLREKLSG